MILHKIVDSINCKNGRSETCWHTISSKIAELRPGEKLRIEAEHNPLSPAAQLQLEREHPDELVWVESDFNPKWILEIERMRNPAPPPASNGTPATTRRGTFHWLFKRHDDEDGLIKSLRFEDLYKVI
jgi:uncharacterized protein (DUF2249 family)